MAARTVIFAALTVSALALSAPARAFTVEQAPSNPDGTARFADPDQRLDQLSQQRQDGPQQGNAAHWYGGDDNGPNYGAPPRDDRSYWGSPLIESPYRQR